MLPGLIDESYELTGKSYNNNNNNDKNNIFYYKKSIVFIL